MKIENTKITINGNDITLTWDRVYISNDHEIRGTYTVTCDINALGYLVDGDARTLTNYSKEIKEGKND